MVCRGMYATPKPPQPPQKTSDRHRRTLKAPGVPISGREKARRASAQTAIPKIRFFAALSLLLAVMQVMGSSGLAKVGRGTGALAPVSRSIPILPRLQKEQT